MKEKIKAQLKTKFSNLGLSEEVFEGVADALAATNLITDENLETAIAGSQPALTKFAAEIDRRVNTLKAENEKLKSGGSNPPKPENPKPNDTPPGDETPAWAKSMTDTIKSLNEKVAQMEAEKTTGHLVNHVKTSLTEKKVPANFVELQLVDRVFKTQEEADAFVAKIETGYKAYEAKLAEDALSRQSENPYIANPDGKSSFVDMLIASTPKPAEAK